MKWSLICALVIMGVVPTLAFSQTSYTLVCRGGGRMHFSYELSTTLSTKTVARQRSAPGQVLMKFEPGSQPAGGNSENAGALQPGQCSWRDRVLTANEPRIVAFLNVQSFSIEWENNKVTKDIQVTNLAAFPFIIDLLNSGKVMTMDVYNNGKGQLVVTQGPFE